MRKANTTGKTTAERLKEAAVSLFGKYGYEGTTVRHIAKKAGVTAGQITATVSYTHLDVYKRQEWNDETERRL